MIEMHTSFCISGEGFSRCFQRVGPPFFFAGILFIWRKELAYFSKLLLRLQCFPRFILDIVSKLKFGVVQGFCSCDGCVSAGLLSKNRPLTGQVDHHDADVDFYPFLKEC